MVGGQQSGPEGEKGVRARDSLLDKDGVSSRGSAEEMEANSVGPGVMGNVHLRKLQGNQLHLVAVDENVQELECTVAQQVQKCCVLQRDGASPVEGHKHKGKLGSSRRGGLVQKEFMPGNSLLTDLYEVKHIQTIYNIFIVTLLLFFVHTAVYDLVVAGKLNFGIDIIQWNFQGLTTAFYIWVVMLATTVLLFFCFKVWAIQRMQWTKNSVGRKCWDYGWLILLIVYQTAFLCTVPIKIMQTVMHPASSMALLMEQVRLLMKSHAFVRSNVPRILAYKPRQSGDRPEMPPRPAFSKYLYFLFAPTLVYKDEYPRTKEFRWRFVVRCFLEWIGCILYAAFIFERFLIPVFRDVGKQYVQNTPFYKILVVGVFSTMIPGTVLFVLAFYGVLHAWINAFAEMMQFADRMFYKDWWNASSQAAYYRLWNVIVHDWLYTYVYRDFSEYLLPGRRHCQAIVVVLISAIFHEYIMAFTFRFCYPVMFVCFFGYTACTVYWTKDIVLVGNILLWLRLIIGCGVITCLYGFESYARANCPRVLGPVSDFFVPRSWTCLDALL